jgi:chemotaxis protein methyltransferase CheR
VSTLAPRPRHEGEPPPGPDYERLCRGVLGLCGIDLTKYRSGQMERRLRTFAERQGLRDLDQYLALMRRDEAVRRAFLDRMTINVSELFRNPERFAELERDHLPGLVAGVSGGLRAWSAGCSYGAEPYTLSVILQEAAPGRRHEVIGSDLDRTVLARARAGRFSEADVRSVPRERLARWFTESDGGWEATPRLRAPLSFRQHDLLATRYPAGLDLIACRNVVIYFTEEAKDAIYRRFFAALRPGGILFVGSTERITRADAIGWEKVGTFFYRRPA